MNRLFWISPFLAAVAALLYFFVIRPLPDEKKNAGPAERPRSAEKRAPKLSPLERPVFKEELAEALKATAEKEKEKNRSAEELANIEERYNKLKADYEMRLARLKGRSHLRKTIRGPVEPGNAWDYYTKGLDDLQRITEEDGKSDVFELAFDRRELDPEEFAKRLKSMGLEDEKALDLKVAELLKECQGVFDLVDKGARQEYVDPKYEYEKGLGMTLPSVANQITLAKAMTVAIEHRIKNNDLAGATDLYLDALQFSDDVAHDGPLVNKLVATMNHNVIAESTIDGIISPIELAKLSSGLDALLRGEEHMADMWEVEYLTASATLLSPLPEIEILEMPMGKTKKIELNKPIIVEFLETYDRRTKERKEMATLPLFDLMRAAFATDDTGKKSKNPLEKALSFPSQEVYKAIGREKASLSLLKTALTIKMYALETGIFPQRLEDLVVAGYLNELPADPFARDSFKYTVSDDRKRATLYSVGENLTDDGGHVEKDIVRTLRLP